MAFKYIGKGDSIYDVPARDLSDEEVKQFGEILVLSSGLYIKDHLQPESNKVSEPRSKKTWRE